MEERVKERTAELVSLNAVYERFVPREFLSLLGKQSILEIKLGDQINQQMTVMFADVRGWTTLSESMSPQDNFNFINAYLKRVGPVIKEHNGFIDQYLGDGVMALFPGRPDDAVEAAIAMHKAVAGYNSEREQDGFQPIGIGVGMFQSPNNSAIMGSAPPERLGIASGMLAVTRTLGQTTGIAILGALWAVLLLAVSVISVVKALRLDRV